MSTRALAIGTDGLVLHERQAFIRSLALLYAGENAQEEQIAAFEQAFARNTPDVETGLICVDEVYIGGLETSASTPVVARIIVGGMIELNLAMNLLGGIVRWSAGRGRTLRPSTRRTFEWSVTPVGWYGHDDGSRRAFAGHVRYIDQSMAWRTHVIEGHVRRGIGYSSGLWEVSDGEAAR